MGQMPYYLLVTVGLEKKIKNKNKKKQAQKKRTKGPGKHSKESRCSSITALLAVCCLSAVGHPALSDGQCSAPSSIGSQGKVHSAAWERWCAVSVGRASWPGCAGSWQWRGGEHTTSAVLGNSAAAVTVEPHWNVFVYRKVKLVIFLSLWHVSREKLLCVSTASGVLIAASRRLRREEDCLCSPVPSTEIFFFSLKSGSFCGVLVHDAM